MNTVTITKPELNYYGSEAVKSLRTNLQFCGGDKKVIVFTSCLQNEGKTRTILNLAIGLSEIGKKVLLLDADLRKSVLLGRCHASGKINGLTHFLAKQVPLKDVICRTNIPNFDIIFAGPVPPNPAELLSGEYFGAMIEALREYYDYILIDSPPLGNVIDSAVIAGKCDGSVFVIESGWNSWRLAQDVKQQLERTGCPILGVILNKVNLATQKYYGRYSRYGRYGKYGKYGRYASKYGEYGSTDSADQEAKL